MNHKALIKHLPLPGTDPIEDTAPNQIHAAQWVCTVREQAVPERAEQVSPLRPSPKGRALLQSCIPLSLTSPEPLDG